MEYIFEKYRINGNDYLVFDVNKFQYELSPEKIRKICRHHFGVGIHGVIMGPYITEDSMHVRMFYKDGTEVERDSNALCAFGLYLKEHDYVYDNSIILNTMGGLVEIELSDVAEGSVQLYMEHNCGNAIFAGNTVALSLDENSSGLQKSKILASTVKESIGNNNGMLCITGKARQTGKIITADHFVENL